MKDPKRAKWILGSSGIILSALMLSQFSNEAPQNNSDTATKKVVETTYTEQEEKQMSKREKELVSLDWTNFEIVTTTPQQTSKQSDRTTKES